MVPAYLDYIKKKCISIKTPGARFTHSTALSRLVQVSTGGAESDVEYTNGVQGTFSQFGREQSSSKGQLNLEIRGQVSTEIDIEKQSEQEWD